MLDIYCYKLLKTVAATVLLLFSSCGNIDNPFRSEVRVNIDFDKIEETQRNKYVLPEQTQEERHQISHINEYSNFESMQ